MPGKVSVWLGRGFPAEHEHQHLKLTLGTPKTQPRFLSGSYRISSLPPKQFLSQLHIWKGILKNKTVPSFLNWVTEVRAGPVKSSPVGKGERGGQGHGGARPQAGAQRVGASLGAHGRSPTTGRSNCLQPWAPH